MITAGEKVLFAGHAWHAIEIVGVAFVSLLLIWMFEGLRRRPGSDTGFGAAVEGRRTGGLGPREIRAKFGPISRIKTLAFARMGHQCEISAADISGVNSPDIDPLQGAAAGSGSVAGSGLDALTAVSRIGDLLRAHPGARFAAGAPDSRPMVVPELVPVARERCLEPRIFDILVSDDYETLIEALSESRRSGHGRALINFAIPGSEPVTIDVLNTAEAFGAVLCVLSVEDEESTFLDRLNQHEVTPLRSRLTQDDLGRILNVDEALESMLGFIPGELNGHLSSDFVHPQDMPSVTAGWRELLGDPAHPRLERLRYRSRQGEYIWFDVMQTNRLAQNGVVIWSFVDVSDEMAAQQRIAEREQLLHQITESLPIGVLQVDVRGLVRHTNTRLAAVLGFPVLSHLDEIGSYVSVAEARALEDALAAALGGDPADVRVTITPPNDRARVCDVNMRRLSGNGLSGNSTSGGALVCFTDVTEAVRLQQQLEYQASHDSLTGCLNRQAVLAFLDGELRSAGGALAAVFIDLDMFKLANDRHGHAAGDEILSVVGRRLLGLLGTGDAAGRLGGDEFLAVFRDVGSMSEARTLGERVVAALNGELSIADGLVRITASVGVGWARRDGVTGDEIVARADAAMYAAKSTGGCSCVVYQAVALPRQPNRAAERPAPAASDGTPGAPGFTGIAAATAKMGG